MPLVYRGYDRRRARKKKGSVLLLRDSVTRADSAVAPGAATETGQAWAAGRGVWGVSGNTLYVPTPNGADYDVMHANVGASNVRHRATVAAVPVGGQGVMIRYTDADHFVKAEWQGAGATAFVIVKRNGVGVGFETVLGSGSGAGLASGGWIEMRGVGSALSASQSGGGSVGPVSDAFNSTATRVGQISFNSAASRFDNIETDSL